MIKMCPRSTGPVLGHAFSAETANVCNDIADEPIFDMDDEDELKECMHGYDLRREPEDIDTALEDGQIDRAQHGS